MFFESTKRISVSFRNKSSHGFLACYGRVLKGSLLIGLLLYLGVSSAKPDECEDIPPNIVVPDDTYECHVFDVSNVSVEAPGASFISVEAIIRESTEEEEGYIRLGPMFRVAEDASFSASFVPDATYFVCSNSCHDW